MNFIKIAWRDIVNIFKNRFIRVSVTAIIIVPLLYSLLYLYAFWDPYSKLADMPVAVVNLDKGSVMDGEKVNYGDDIAKKLKDNSKIGWRFVSKDEAEKGVKDKDYYAMFVVPEDFSAKVLSAKEGKPEEPNILYTANEKKNFLAAQINGKVMVELKAEITKTITNEYTKVTFDSLYEVKDGMQKAADGSKELKDGIGQVKDKVPEMKDGVQKLEDGSGQLKNGLGQARDGAAQLFYGADALNQALGQAKDGSDKLNTGLNQLNGNVPALKDGISKLTDGSSQLYNGIVTTAIDPITGKPLGLKSGINQLASGLNDAKSKTGELDSGAGQVLDGAKQLGEGLKKLNTAVNIGGNGQPSLLRGLKSINDGVTDPNPQKGLGAGVEALNAAVNTGINGQPSLVSGISQANNGLKQINAGVANQLVPGVTSLNAKVNVGENGKQSLKNAIAFVNTGVSGQLSPTASNLASGAKSLNDLLEAYKAAPDDATKKDIMDKITLAAGRLKAGADGLNAAVNTGVSGQLSLVDAVKQINDGITDPDPQKGLAAGVGALNTAVNIGAKDANGNLIPNSSLKDGIAYASAGLNKINSAVSVSTPTQPSLKDAIEGLNAAVNGKQGLVYGISSLYTAATDKTNGLAAGVTQLNDAVNNGLAGKPSLIAGLTQLKAGTSQFVTGISTAASGANDLSLGANKLSDGSMQIKDGLYALNGNVPTLADGISQLYAGSTQLNGGLTQIKDGSSQLRNAIAKPEEVKDIAKKDSKADSTLFNGVGQLYDGSKELNTGLNTLNGKLPELQDGANKLADGSKELNDKLTEGSDKLNKNLINSSDTMATYISEPLKMDEKPMFPVKNYGTGFAPYFIPLSLWIGALMMFFVITEKVDDDINASSASVVLGKYLSYGFIGITQAILASVVVIALGLRPENVPLYFLFNIFMSLVFIAIIQCLVFLLGMAGRLLSIILLILQLTSCAGTFPLEVVPPLFKVLNPFMPFTYCVSALREVIAGMDYAVFTKDISILAIYMVVFLTISVLFKGHADKVQEKIKEKAISMAS
jgi:putative membrane protein